VLSVLSKRAYLDKSSLLYQNASFYRRSKLKVTREQALTSLAVNTHALDPTLDSSKDVIIVYK
jgi:hypothetical protein